MFSIYLDFLATFSASTIMLINVFFFLHEKRCRFQGYKFINIVFAKVQGAKIVASY